MNKTISKSSFYRACNKFEKIVNDFGNSEQTSAQWLQYDKDTAAYNKARAAYPPAVKAKAFASSMA